VVRELSIFLKVPLLTYVHRKIQKSKTRRELSTFMLAITGDRAWNTWMRKNTTSLTGWMFEDNMQRIENAAYDALSSPYNPFGRRRIMGMGKNLIRNTST
jgi:hypothetical protein